MKEKTVDIGNNKIKSIEVVCFSSFNVFSLSLSICSMSFRLRWTTSLLFFLLSMKAFKSLKCGYNILAIVYLFDDKCNLKKEIFNLFFFLVPFYIGVVMSDREEREKSRTHAHINRLVDSLRWSSCVNQNRLDRATKNSTTNKFSQLRNSELKVCYCCECHENGKLSWPFESMIGIETTS